MEIPGSTARPIEVTIESESGKITFSKNDGTLNFLAEYLKVSTRKMPVPAPVAPHDAYACVDGPPNDAQVPIFWAIVSSTVHPGRTDLIAFRIGMSIINVSAVMVI